LKGYLSLERSIWSARDDRNPRYTWKTWNSDDTTWVPSLPNRKAISYRLSSKLERDLSWRLESKDNRRVAWILDTSWGLDTERLVALRRTCSTEKGLVVMEYTSTRGAISLWWWRLDLFTNDWRICWCRLSLMMSILCWWCRFFTNVTQYDRNYDCWVIVEYIAH